MADNHTPAERRSLVERLIADPPAVHHMSFEDPSQMGVWSTEPSAYHFLAESWRPGWRTLETGSGISTLLLAGLGAEHHCVTPNAGEVERLLDYSAKHNISTERVTFSVGSSDVVLPSLELAEPLDLLLIDGGHGFPLPVIDWFYGARHLRRGGLLLIDDTPLPAVRLLQWFLTADPRWTLVGEGTRWQAYRRENEGPVAEDWFEQPFFHLRTPGTRGDIERVANRVKRLRTGRAHRARRE